jgi:hypothetical protein
MNYRRVFAIALIQVLLFHTASAVSDSLQLNFDTLAQKVHDKQFEYHTLSLHAKLTWGDGNSQQDFTASIRMLKDSIIWMSISGAMGIEAARVLVTPDTFCVINKMANTCGLHGFGFIENWLLFPANFTMLQQIIAGQKIDIKERAGMASVGDSFSIIYTESEKMLEKIWVNNGNYTLAKILLKDKLVTQDMTVTFDDYNEQPGEPGKPFSYQRVIEVNRNGITLSLSIETTKVRLNDKLAYPFDISNKYRRKVK